jgi:hypothetical protein
MSDARADGDGVTRLSFIKRSAGVAAGAAAIGVPAAAAITDESGKVVSAPSERTPTEPVMAYVRDAERGEVTVLAGTTETTYRDPALVRRLLAAVPQGVVDGGGDAHVIAP